MAEVISLIVGRKKQAKSISKALSISVLNQAVSSGTNFFLGIYLVRVLTPVQFGLYGIGFAISLFYASIGNSLLLTQMVINSPDRPKEDRLAYAASMGKAVAVFCSSTILLLLLGLLALGAIWTWFEQFVGYGIAVTFASVAYLLKDFYVRHAYTTRKEIWALYVNIAVAVSLAVFLFILHQQAIAISATGALWLYTVSHMVAAAAGQRFARLPLLAVRGEQLLSDFREAWAEGRWALITALMYTLRTQAYIFVTAWGVGPTGVAYLNAARILVAPAVMLTPALSQVFMPRLADLRASGRGRVVQAGMLFAGILLMVAFVYSGLLLLLLNQILPLVLGPKYQNISVIVFGWCLVTCLLAVRNGGELILQVLKNFRILMVVNSISAFIAIISVVVMIKIMDLTGAVYGLAIAEIILSLALWLIIFRDKESV